MRPSARISAISLMRSEAEIVGSPIVRFAGKVSTSLEMNSLVRRANPNLVLNEAVRLQSYLSEPQRKLG